MATWDEMTEAERALINAQEDSREHYKNSMAGADEWQEAMDAAPVVDELTDAEIEEWAAHQEEYQDGHKDHFYF